MYSQTACFTRKSILNILNNNTTEIPINLSGYPISSALDILLADKSTKKNIIWATDSYADLGDGFADDAHMEAGRLFLNAGEIRPRVNKPRDAQTRRTRKKAEVFTPAWLVNRMNNYCDDDWFGRPGVFNTENVDNTWEPTPGNIAFADDHGWQRYIDSRRLELTCGEAPYIASRYDVTTGEAILPILRRVGMLDRKLRVVNENTNTYDDWLKWALRAFEAVYGYEYQGDNVLLARINLFMTFFEYYEERHRRPPSDKLLRRVANIIAWNIWQMDGLKGTAPLGKPVSYGRQVTLFDGLETGDERQQAEEKAKGESSESCAQADYAGEAAAVFCKIKDWRADRTVRFVDLKTQE